MKQRAAAPILAIATALFVGGAAVAGYLWLRGPQPTAVDESPDQKKTAVREAFVDRPDASADNVEQELNALFEALGKALLAGDGHRAVEHYDYAMLLAAAEQQGLVPPSMRLRRAEMVERVRADQVKQLTATGKVQGWLKHRIVSVRYLKDRSEAVVYARHVDADGVVTKMRWWVVKQEDRWRIYDAEDLSMNLRVSTAAGMGMSAAHEDATWGPSLRTFFNAIQLVVAEDFQSAHEKLLSMESAGFPPQLEGLRLLMLGVCWLWLEKPDKALECYDRADKLGLDMPILHYQRMVVYNVMQQPEKTLAAGKAYLEALGPDADTDLELGFAHLLLENEAEAEKHLTRCLDDVPNHADCLRQLARLVPAEREQEIHRRLLTVDDVSTTARAILELALDEQDYPPMRVVLRALASRDPKHPLVVEFKPKVPPDTSN